MASIRSGSKPAVSVWRAISQRAQPSSKSTLPLLSVLHAHLSSLISFHLIEAIVSGGRSWSARAFAQICRTVQRGACSGRLHQVVSVHTVTPPPELNTTTTLHWL